MLKVGLEAELFIYDKQKYQHQHFGSRDSTQVDATLMFMAARSDNSTIESSSARHNRNKPKSDCAVEGSQSSTSLIRTMRLSSRGTM